MKKKTIQIMIGIFVILICVISVGPFLWVLLSSFRGNADILSSASIFNGHFSFKNYFTAFKLAPIAQFYKNSVIVTVMSTLICLTVMSMASYVIARFQFRGRKFLRLMFSMALLIPGSALLLPVYNTVKTIGLLDTIPGLILVYSGFGLTTSLFILSSYFMTIPRELEESAYIDGAGFFRTFATIIMPLVKPALATAGVLQFIEARNEFQFALTLTTGNDSRTLPVALYYFKSAYATDYGAMFAATILIILPTIVIYFLMQEQVVSGMTAGAVKG
ncbi:carbohydrate ABC transporter permease [Eubacterium sp. am_0171]|uniref:Inner membrane ABC transporter permease protein ycjP n=1 Tax=Faecalicatena contorta TaxID=39482 RepID=A0A174GNQ3_9FIRM|nr:MULTISPECIES: carbohydrate ABC transporter permease [Clostridia]MSC86236.1 ABC transporter permease subunit [Eubacterium sp. BIOML-A1]MSD08584.1 ABC transporter permease subunit [Eubacterium sp. BIOML-A2]RYT11877.1 carbohydrate ABC transporter permease [Eubacterium sp. am_0171]CUO63591.1 Inner membrane ABC transporter permease protein ycjP [[Eubacterium] contortum] [Faecalicatena contorta]